MIKLDLGIVRVVAVFDYKVPGLIGHNWERWVEGAYPEYQLLAPSVYTFESHFINSPYTQDSERPSPELIRGLASQKNISLELGWESNPFLQTPALKQLLIDSLHSGASISIFSGYICIVDMNNHCIYEFFNDKKRKEAIQKFPMASLKMLFTYLLPEIETYFMHGCGVIFRDRKAIIFLAPSGGGKTSVARLAKAHGYRVLGDDRILVSKHKENKTSFLCVSVPFNKITDGPNWGHIAAVVFLRWDSFFSLRSVSPIEALSRIWADRQGQWGRYPPKYRKDLFLFYEALLAQVPAYEMGFPEGFVDWNALERIVFS